MKRSALTQTEFALAESIDLAQLLMPHTSATYFMKVKGDSMHGAGIDEDDILVVDKAVRPKHGHVIVAVVNGGFVFKFLNKRGGRMKLQSANPTYPDIIASDDDPIEIWGVVTSRVKQFSI